MAKYSKELWHMTKAERIEIAARKLLVAMDRQYGQPVFSQNVEQARQDLQMLLPDSRDERDKSRAV
jgi:hypothetical protein